MAIDSRSFLTREVYFLLMLPLFFVLHGYLENFRLVHPVDCLLLLGAYWLAFGLIATLCYFIFRSWRKAALFCFCLMCFHFFFGSAHDVLKDILPGSFFIKYTFVLPF